MADYYMDKGSLIRVNEGGVRVEITQSGERVNLAPLENRDTVLPITARADNLQANVIFGVLQAEQMLWNGHSKSEVVKAIDIGLQWKKPPIKTAYDDVKITLDDESQKIIDKLFEKGVFTDVFTKNAIMSIVAPELMKLAISLREERDKKWLTTMFGEPLTDDLPKTMNEVKDAVVKGSIEKEKAILSYKLAYKVLLETCRAQAKQIKKLVKRVVNLEHNTGLH